jgi:hypothetical protein
MAIFFAKLQYLPGQVPGLKKDRKGKPERTRPAEQPLEMKTRKRYPPLLHPDRFK